MLRCTEAVGPPHVAGVALLQLQGVRVAEAEARQATAGGEHVRSGAGITAEPAVVVSMPGPAPLGLGLGGGDVLPNEGLELQLRRALLHL